LEWRWWRFRQEKSLWKNRSNLGQWSRKMKARPGKAEGITATAHRLARIVWNMIAKQEAYDAAKACHDHHDPSGGEADDKGEVGDGEPPGDMVGHRGDDHAVPHLDGPGAGADERDAGEHEHPGVEPQN
jgi:hypothetical protein